MPTLILMLSLQLIPALHKSFIYAYKPTYNAKARLGAKQTAWRKVITRRHSASSAPRPLPFDPYFALAVSLTNIVCVDVDCAGSSGHKSDWCIVAAKSHESRTIALEPTLCFVSFTGGRSLSYIPTIVGADELAHVCHES